MRRVAVFGNAGAGKSALARRLAELMGLPLYPIDIVQYPNGYRPQEKDGGRISQEEYLKFHADLLRQDRWIVDGFDTVASAWERFSAADTLVYIDLPLAMNYAWVTKRLVKGLFRNPPGWPGEQPGVEQFVGQLPGDLALSSRIDAEIPAARCRCFIVQTGSSFEVFRGNIRASPNGGAGASMLTDTAAWS